MKPVNAFLLATIAAVGGGGAWYGSGQEVAPTGSPAPLAATVVCGWDAASSMYTFCDVQADHSIDVRFRLTYARFAACATRANVPQTDAGCRADADFDHDTDVDLDDLGIWQRSF